MSRPFTWAALFPGGDIIWEEEARSIDNITRKDEIGDLALFRADDLSDPTGHHAVNIPTDAEPICFTRVSITLNPESEAQTQDATSVIGWRRGETQMLLFVYSDGSCAVFDRDPDEVS